MTILNGKVIAKDIVRYMLGFALGTESRIAAGTAIYDALAQSIENIKASFLSKKSIFERIIPIIAFIKGITIAKIVRNTPTLLSSESFLEAIIPISKRNIESIPLNKLSKSGDTLLYPFSPTNIPIIKVPISIKTDGFTKASLKTNENLISSLFRWYIWYKTNATIIAGDSIKAIAAIKEPW